MSDTLEPNLDNLDKLEKKINYSFKDTSLLAQALTHRSYINEHCPPNNRKDSIGHNQRLEFLGDAIISLIVAQALFERFPQKTEGPLSAMRASLVNDASLAQVGLALDLGSYMLLGQGEIASGGQTKASILADCFEALVAAIYLDGGLDEARKHVLAHLSQKIAQVTPTKYSKKDFKSQLQRITQKLCSTLPSYEIIDSFGPNHHKTFVSRVSVCGEVIGEGSGYSKKAADQAAANKALEVYVSRYPEEVEAILKR